MIRKIFIGTVIISIFTSARIISHVNANENVQNIVKEFEGIVNNAVKLSNSYSGFVAQIDQGPYNRKWTRDIIQVKDVSYDVKKSDSLISPIIGVVTGECRSCPVGFFTTRQQAKNVSRSMAGNKQFYKFKIDYAYQDGKWVLKKALVQFTLIVQGTIVSSSWVEQWTGTFGVKDHSMGLVHEFWSP